MISEELGINAHLAAHGVTPIETDLGEYIIQLRDETPSHIIAPAFHLNREDWEAQFRLSHTDLPADRVFAERRDILTEARLRLRSKFLAADVGITGANFLIAETGSSVIVTNEGNGDLTQTLPRVHIALASIEKCVPTLEDATSLLRLLARSATGQDFSVYTTFSTGGAPARRPRRARAISCRAGRQRALRDARHRVPGDAALHPLRRLHEPLPGLWRGRRARLWLGVSGADGQRADAEPDRRGPGRPAAEREHVLRQVRERVPGEDPVAEDDAALARARVRAPPAAGVGPDQSRAVGMVRAPAGRVPAGDAGGRRGCSACSGAGAGRFRRLPFAGGWTGGRDLPAPEGETFFARYERRQRQAARTRA